MKLSRFELTLVFTLRADVLYLQSDQKKGKIDGGKIIWEIRLISPPLLPNDNMHDSKWVIISNNYNNSSKFKTSRRLFSKNNFLGVHVLQQEQRARNCISKESLLVFMAGWICCLPPNAYGHAKPIVKV